MKITSSAQVAKMIDHAILHPTIQDKDVEIHAKLCIDLDVASLCVKPYHVSKTYQLLHESEVLTCAVIGFPHGNNAITTKVFETQTAINDGAQEIDMVVNIGKVVQHDWEYVKHEIESINKVCQKNMVPLKVIFETDFLTKDADKIQLCKICSELKVAYVKTSTGFGYVKQDDGHYDYTGATDHDIKLMRKHCSPKVNIKASGGIRSLDDIIRLHGLGATRIGTSSTVALVKEAKERFGE
jgi:deoxyribose-phosphate aldolase